METQLNPPPVVPSVRKHPHAENAEHSNGHEPQNGHAQAHADHDEIDLDVPHARSGWVIAAAVLGVVILATLLVVGLLPRQESHKELAAAADSALNAPVPVNIIAPRRADETVNVVLPGTLRPWQEVSIYSRSTGYLKHFDVDISDQVKKNQLMAEISTPEIDQQLRAAQATLALDQAAANKAKTDLDYAALTDRRYESLRGTSGVTQQELDQYASALKSSQAAYQQALAQVGVAQANVQQLTEMQSFENITAPFAGVVTGRTYDVGAFIIANPTAADIPPMFKIAENDVLRAFVNVPQNYALEIKMGMKVTITARERPGREFTGTVLGTTNYLDPAARSLLTEVRIENPDLALLPGMYVDATFHVTRDHPPLLIPAPALITNADGNMVAVMKDDKVHFQKVTLGVDYGNDVEIVSGLNADDKIIGNPGEKTVEGAEVVAAGHVKETPLPTEATQAEAARRVVDAGK